MKQKLCFCLLIVSLFSLPVATAEDDSLLVKVIQDHCVDCHGDDGEGGVNLNLFKEADDFLVHPELLEDLVAVLRDRRMPPEDGPELADKDRDEMIDRLRRLFATAVKDEPFKPTPIRRMNRFQYNNAVMDLLELDRDLFQLNERLLRRRDDYFRPSTRKMPDQVRVSSRPLSKDIDNQRPEGFRGVAPFPQDQRAEHGFDNRADHLSMSPLLMESFLKLSTSIAASPDLNPQECRSWDRLFGEPGKSLRGPVKGRYEGENNSAVRVIGTTKGNPVNQDMRPFGPLWSGNSQLFWMGKQKGLEISVEIDVQSKANGLKFQFTNAPDYGNFDIYWDGEKIADAVNLYNNKVDIIGHEVGDMQIEPGRHRLKFRNVGKDKRSSRFFFGLDYVQLTGVKEKRKPVVQPLPVHDVVRRRIAWLLRRAFRSSVDQATLDRFSAFAISELESGKSMEQAMRSIVAAVLATPEFLYLTESKDGHVHRKARMAVTQFELATRLAQFFWSSIPDDELLDLAEKGRLDEPQIVAAQIDRMLDDRRSSRFCDNFPGQWLQLDRLVTAIPDRKKYPYFYYNGYRTSMHMMSEPLLLFETVFVEDRSVMDLIAPDFTWQSHMLRVNYEGKSNVGQEVQVQTFRRVKLDDPRQGGVITNAAIMTMTSTPTRTQPITRGAWVNAVIFNDPPEPPPADVPPLPEKEDHDSEKLTIRERLSQHRERADCAGCHDQIDPLGFALENYGPTGVWRDKYENGRDVDASGVFFRRHDFKTPVEFKQLIVKEKSRFIRAFLAHLMSYALGRELGPADSPALDRITQHAVDGNDSLRDLMKQIAMSEPFFHKNVK